MKCSDNRFLSVVLLICFLSACSSPPEPPMPDRSSKSEQVNATIPLWKPNNDVIPSQDVSGHWQIRLANFRGDVDTYPPSFWYGIVHSSHIMIAAGPGTDWFAIKAWLRNHGAKQVIEYRIKPGCYNCADIYMSR